MLCARLEPGSGSGIGNKAIIISAEQQSHTEEYGVVHGSSNHIRKNTKEYGVLHVERIIRSSCIYRRNSGFKDNGAHERKGNPAGSVYVCF